MRQHALFMIGNEEGDHIRIEIAGRAYPTATDFWDANWLHTRISVRAGGFRAGVNADLRTTDLVGFREEISGLDQTHIFSTFAQLCEIEETYPVIGQG